MFCSHKKSFYIFTLLLLLTNSRALFAQQTDTHPINTHAEWQGQLDEHTQRQEFREETQKIRAEHEELEAERDAIKSQCLDAKGQEKSTCADRWKVWKQKHDVLHDRMKSLNEKMAADKRSRSAIDGSTATAIGKDSTDKTTPPTTP